MPSWPFEIRRHVKRRRRYQLWRRLPWNRALAEVGVVMAVRIVPPAGEYIGKTDLWLALSGPR